MPVQLGEGQSTSLHQLIIEYVTYWSYYMRVVRDFGTIAPAGPNYVMMSSSCSPGLKSFKARSINYVDVIGQGNYVF